MYKPKILFFFDWLIWLLRTARENACRVVEVNAITNQIFFRAQKVIFDPTLIGYRVASWHVASISASSVQEPIYLRLFDKEPIIRENWQTRVRAGSKQCTLLFCFRYCRLLTRVLIGFLLFCFLLSAFLPRCEFSLKEAATRYSRVDIKVATLFFVELRNTALLVEQFNVNGRVQQTTVEFSYYQHTTIICWF